MARPHAQDGRWAWIVCVSATLSWLVALAFVFSFGIFFPVFMDYFKETREKTGKSFVSISLLPVDNMFLTKSNLAAKLLRKNLTHFYVYRGERSPRQRDSDVAAYSQSSR